MCTLNDASPYYRAIDNGDDTYTITVYFKTTNKSTTTWNSPSDDGRGHYTLEIETDDDTSGSYEHDHQYTIEDTGTWELDIEVVQNATKPPPNRKKIKVKQRNCL